MNTFFEHGPDELATYRDLGSPLGAPTTYEFFGQIDHVLVPEKWSSCVIDVKAERMAILQSYHSPVFVDLDISIPKQKNRRCEAVDLHSLSDDAVRLRYCDTFVQALRDHSTESADVDAAATRIASAMHEASSQLPQRRATKQRPWISSETLGLIDRRNLARQSNQRDLVVTLSKRVKASAKWDSQAYINRQHAQERGLASYPQCATGKST